MLGHLAYQGVDNGHEQGDRRTLVRDIGWARVPVGRLSRLSNPDIPPHRRKYAPNRNAMAHPCTENAHIHAVHGAAYASKITSNIYSYQCVCGSLCKH